MSIILMMLLGLICVQESLPDLKWPAPPDWVDAWLGPSGSLLATLGCLGVVWLIGCLDSLLCCRALIRNPDRIRTVRRRFRAMQNVQFFMLTGMFILALYSLGWGHYIRTLFDDQRAFLPGKELALMAPFLLALIGSWFSFYDFERLLHEVEMRRIQTRQPAADVGQTPVARKLPWWRVPIEQFLSLGLAPRRKSSTAATLEWTPPPQTEPSQPPSPSPPPFLSRAAFVGLQARFNLLMIVPPLTLMLMQQLVLWYFPWLRQDESFRQYFLAGFLVLALLSLPWLLRIFLWLRPLPAGPLRDRLQATIRRLKFRCSNILLWNTRDSSTNAMVTGLLPWPRYIVLTDQLVRDLSPDEIEAVLGHEIGHVKHHHMFYYMMFLFGSLTAMGAIWEICNTLLQSPAVIDFLRDYAPFVERLLESGRQFQAFPATLALGLYLFVVFGYLSRCCETQADIYGSRTTSTEAFVSALEKVADLNNIPREKPGWFASWRHPSIARRVEFLLRMRDDPNLEPRFQRSVGRFKWSLALALTLLLAAIWAGGGFTESRPANQQAVAPGEQF